MNWEALGAMAEVLGAAGVILTLLYLSSQVKQSLKDTRADAIQQLSRDYASHSSEWVDRQIVARDGGARFWRYSPG